MIKLVISIFLTFTVFTYTQQFEDSSSVFSLEKSPYYLGNNNPGQLYNTIINTNSLIVIFGGNPLIIPVNPSSEDYFKTLVEILSIFLTSEVQNSDELVNQIDKYLGNLGGYVSNISQVLDRLKTILNREKMSAVRGRDKESLRVINSILSKINLANKYSTYIDKLLVGAKTLNDCLKIIVRATKPLATYKGFDSAVNIMLNQNNLPMELRGALNDILTVSKGGEEAFLANIKNSTSDISQIIMDLASKMYEDNRDKINKITMGLLGKKNYNYLNEMLKARDFIHDFFGQIINFDEAIKTTQPLYNTANLDVHVHKTIFNNKQSLMNDEYIESLKLLMLIESKLMYQYSELFNAYQKSGIGNFADAINESNQNSKKCLEAFTALDSINR